MHAETLNMATLDGYNVGGPVHVIVNNLLGFTALPEESNSSRFSTDIAKRLPIPIFHVNAEDPDAVLPKRHADVERFRLTDRTCYRVAMPTSKVARIQSVALLIHQWVWRCPRLV